MPSASFKPAALSDNDVNLLRRLAHRRALWQRARWLFIALGVCMLGLGAFFWVALWQELKQEQLLLMLIAVVAPACSLLTIVGVIFIGYAFSRWRGDRRTELLLRLTEDRLT